jgi:cysteine-rich repeat protein
MKVKSLFHRSGSSLSRRLALAWPLGVAFGCGNPATRDYTGLPTEESSLLSNSNSEQQLEPDNEADGASESTVGTVTANPVSPTAPGTAVTPGTPATGTVNTGVTTTDDSSNVTQPASVCGDAQLDANEACDDGASNSDAVPNACRVNCTQARCGDTVTDDGEECDDGNLITNDGCNDCNLPYCGDGVVQGTEACDDGNDVVDDDCNECAVPGCGDGVTQSPREECDDGAVTDTCTAACKHPTCGDGFTQSGEECDDGNTVDNDTCTADCESAKCGDSLLSTGETCEDGNTENGDGCTSLCQLEVCGDGILSVGESCEDGNKLDGDGCSSTCQTEICGDSKKTGIEQCDDGNRNDNDGCSAMCRNEVCGDGVVQAPREDCEDLNTVDTDVCRNGCKHAKSLNALSSSCANVDQITQTVCMVATDNWCQQYNNNPIAGMVTGEKADNEYYVGCINGFTQKEYPTSQLDQCPGGRQQSPSCLEQINNACESLGYSQGFYLGNGSSGNFAIACGSGAVSSASVQGCNGIADTSPVPVACAQALATKCGNNKGGMIQARAQSNQVTYTCIDLSLTGTVRQL